MKTLSKPSATKHLVHIVVNNPPGEESPKTFEEEDQLGGLPVIAPFAPDEIRGKQRADTYIHEVLR